MRWRLAILLFVPCIPSAVAQDFSWPTGHVRTSESLQLGDKEYPFANGRNLSVGKPRSRCK